MIARSQKNVLDIIWNQYVTSGMSDYEKAVAAQQWMQQNVSPNGTSVLAQKALEQGKANYKGFCEAYQLIMKHYGISAKVVNGKKHMENSVVIAGKNIRHQRWKLQRMQIKHILQHPFRDLR